MKVPGSFWMGSEAEEIPWESQGSTAQLWRMVSTAATAALTSCGHSFIAAEQIQAQPQLCFFSLSLFVFLSSPPLFQAADRISNVCKRPMLFKCPSDTNWEREVCKWHRFIKTASCNTLAVGPINPITSNPPPLSKKRGEKECILFNKRLFTQACVKVAPLFASFSPEGHMQTLEHTT